MQVGRQQATRALRCERRSSAALRECLPAGRRRGAAPPSLPPADGVCGQRLTSRGRGQGLGSAGARALLQADFGSNTPAGFRPGTQVGAQCPTGTRHCDEQNSCVDTLTDKLNCGAHPRALPRPRPRAAPPCPAGPSGAAPGAHAAAARRPVRQRMRLQHRGLRRRPLRLPARYHLLRQPRQVLHQLRGL